jgi:hypothetical protein
MLQSRDLQIFKLQNPNLIDWKHGDEVEEGDIGMPKLGERRAESGEVDVE